MRKIKKIKGYTLVELLIGTGILSLAAIGVYTVAMVASDWRKSSQEVKSLSITMGEIDNSTLTTGSYSGITLSSLGNYSTGFNSALQLREVVAPSAKKLNFVYENMNSRICNDFAGKMLQSSKNIGAVINGTEITSNNLNDIASACDRTGGSNAVTIVLNKAQDDYTINNVVASVNPPPAPPPDIVIPGSPVPQVPPTINAFTPSGLNPGTYPLVTGGPPTFTPGPGGGGPIVVTPGTNPPTTISPPPWTPPTIGRPVAPTLPPDQLDQDPNPPIVTTETRTLSCGAGYIGAITESRIRTFYQSTGVVNYSPWIEVSNSCTLAPVPLVLSKQVYLDFYKGSSRTYTLTFADANATQGKLEPAIQGQWGRCGGYPYGEDQQRSFNYTAKIENGVIVSYMTRQQFDDFIYYIWYCLELGS